MDFQLPPALHLRRKGTIFIHRLLGSFWFLLSPPQIPPLFPHTKQKQEHHGGMGIYSVKIYQQNTNSLKRLF